MNRDRARRIWCVACVRYKVLSVAFLGIVMLLQGSRLWAQQPAGHPAVVAHVNPDASHAAGELLARRVTITLKKVSLKRAIDNISRVAKVFIQYQAPMLTAYTMPVTLDVTDVPLGTVLEQVLDGTNLRVVPDGRDWLAIVALPEQRADSVPSIGVVSGRVVDSATGKGVAGATVKVAGTKLTVVASDSGRFILKSVPVGNVVLTVRTFGYRPIDRGVTVVDGTPVIVRIMVTAAPNVLSGVVTTAAGVQRKIEVGNDITTLNVDSVMRVAPVSSVTDLLETRVPGLTVVHSSGTPGDPARLRLRGAGSVQLNNDPIMIVDGIRVYAQQSDSRNQNLAPSKQNLSATGPLAYNAPSPLDQIDPNSIETLEVLKGPSASAIYGSDAASGVIVITTKHGQAGVTHWAANAAAGVNWLPGQWPTNYYRFGNDHIGTTPPFCPWYIVGCDIDSVVPFQALNDPRYTILAHGSTQEASLSVSGGASTVAYSLTGSTNATLGNLKLPGSEVQRYDSLYGTIPHSLVRPDKYTTWGMTGSLRATPRPTMQVTLQSSLFSGTQRRSSLQGEITTLTGEYVSPTLVNGPLFTGEYERASDDALTSNNSLSLQWRPWSWLPLMATGGINTMQRVDVSYVPFGIYDDQYNADGTLAKPEDTTGFYGLGRGTSRMTTLTAGTQVPTFRNRITTAVGGTFNSTSTADFQVYTNQLAPGVSVPTTFTTNNSCVASSICNSPTNQSTFSQSAYGWYVQPTLNLNSRLFASPGFRLDGGSGGTKNSSLGGLSGFPKIDFSYVAVDRENSRPLFGVISTLRPRIAYGYAGTQPAPADKLRLYNIGTYTMQEVGQTSFTGSGLCAPLATLDGVTEVPAVCINTLGNTVLRPERSSELEGGFDATLWQNRLSITLSAYNKTRHDAIIPVPVAQSVFSSGSSPMNIQKNIGVVRNTGTEVTMSATPVQSRALSWTLGGNFSQDHNVVVRLNKGQLPIVLYAGASNGVSDNGLQTRVQAGYPLFAEFAKPIVSYADANHNGIIDPGEVRYNDSSVYVGHPDPNYQIFVNNDVSVFQGKLSVHATLAYASGLTQYNAGACAGAVNGSFALLPNTPNTSLATEAAVVAAGCVNGSVSQSPIGVVQTVNTLRFQSMSLNYVVPTRIANWLRVPRVSLALQGENLGLHTNYRGKDPDVNAFATVNAGDQTRDTGQIPEPRTWLLRITLEN